MTIVSKADWVATIPHTKRLRYSGSNISNVIGPVCLPPFEQLWSLPCSIKYQVRGPALGQTLQCSGSLHRRIRSNPCYTNLHIPSHRATTV